ncbi:WSC domain-containing protein [Mrakia frigida]|uniref:WSC domain-containing protein n=1 Tax=Mrakia frigida TaxID=29902 RepID=UPI003FCC228A
MPSTINTLTVLAALSFFSTSVVASLGHHAHPGLTSLSHLPPVVGVLADDGEILTTQQEATRRRSLDPRYYGDSRGFTRPAELGNQKRAIPAGWAEVGCVAEGTSSRTLNGFSYIDSAMTTESCLATCLQKGFTYGGMEWSDECYCGNSFEGGGGSTTGLTTSCSMPCAGSASEMCGGNYVLSAYSYTSSGSTDACGTVAPTTVVASATASATASGSVVASATITSSAATASATGSSGSTTTEWESLGCFYDNPDENNSLHILTGTSLLDQSNMTPELCQTRCAGQGYNFAGLEYGQECWCGDLTATEVSALTSNAPWCNMQCTGDSSLTCGGGWSMDVYEQVDVSDDC